MGGIRSHAQRHQQRPSARVLAIVAAAVTAAGGLSGCATPPASADSAAIAASAGASSGTPDAARTLHDPPTALAGIDPAKLPTSDAEVAAALSKLPATLNGFPVTTRSERAISYADGTALHAQPLSEAAGPNEAMTTFFPRFTAMSGLSVKAQNDPGAPLLWFAGTGRSPYGAHVVGIASSGGSWLFGLDAPTEGAADQLIGQFVATLR